MHKILVLTRDADATTHDDVVRLMRGTAEDSYLFVCVLDGLVHYRHASVSEEKAREVIGC